MLFTSEYRVAIGDINYGGHLGNDRALVIFQDARLLFLQSLGCTETDIGEGLGIIMIESGVRYLREVFHNDTLTTTVAVADIAGKKFVLEYRVVRHGEDELVLTGSTTFLIFNYDKRRVASMPPDFRKQLKKHLQG